MSGYGSVRKNRSITGKALKLDGKIFNNGLGTHANSDIRYNIPPAAKRFSSVCHIYSSRKEKSLPTTSLSAACVRRSAECWEPVV